MDEYGVDDKDLPFCTICEDLDDSEGILRCEACPCGVSQALPGCGSFKPKAGTEEIARRWLIL